MFNFRRTEVVSMRNGNKNFDIRIDRESEWGNRHYMKGDSLAERDRVCDIHKKELWEKIRSGDITLSQLDKLYGKKLGCWCFPKRCHGDALAEAAEWAHRLLLILARLRKRRNAKRNNRSNRASRKRARR